MTGFDPSAEQVAAATSKKPVTVVLAPPGCGKTEVLAYRANHLIGTLDRNQRILALTFTNRARANLSERFAQIMGADRARRFVTVRNFHGHAADIVLSHYRTIGLDLSTYTPPTKRTLTKAVRQITTDSDKVRDATALLNEVKRKPISDEEVLAALDGSTGRLGRTTAIAVEVARQSANELHYEDLLRHAQCLLRVPGVRRLYNCHYGAVLVDEFQDLSLQQLDLVSRTCSTSRTFAGDPLQGIYTWAGAQPGPVAATLHADCPDAFRLSESYRSSPSVLALVNSIGAQLGATTLHSAQEDAWPDAGFGTACVFADLAEEASQVVSATRLLLDCRPDLSIGVVSRSAWRRSTIDEYFASSDLPVRRWDLAVDDPQIVQLVRDGMLQLPHGVSFEAARAAVLDTVDPTDVDTFEQIGDVFDLLGRSGKSTPRAALQVLRSSGEAQQAVSPGVHLLNAHTGKGQQFDWTFVIGLEEKHVPDKRSASGGALTEEMRVLLVMLSRARHGLVVTRATTLDGMYGPYAPLRSRWYDTLADAQTNNWSSLSEHVRLALGGDVATTRYDSPKTSVQR